LAVLIGSGTLSGSGKTLAVSGSFRPGNSPGTVTVDTGFLLDLSGATGTTFDITDPVFAAGSYSLVDGAGSAARSERAAGSREPRHQHRLELQVLSGKDRRLTHPPRQHLNTA